MSARDLAPDARWERVAAALERIRDARPDRLDHGEDVRRLEKASAIARAALSDLAALQADLAAAREQLRLATIDASNEMARANDAEADLARTRAALGRLGKAARGLSANVKGAIELDKYGMRSAIGNTNVAVLRHWTDQAAAALADPTVAEAMREEA